MKIIDLLNKIANGEEVPKKVKFAGIIFEYDEDEQMHFADGFKNICDYAFLNEEVEIIEEDNNKIKKLKIVDNGSTNSYALLNEYGTKCGLTKHSKIMCDKINELTDEINKLKENK